MAGWLLAGGLLFVLALQERERTVAGLALPEGRVAEALAALAPAAAPRALEFVWPAWSDRSEAGWGGEPAWRRWVELLRAESAASRASPVRRAELAVLARLQGRDGDAWEHLLACVDEPGLVATLLPLFSPGVPVEELGQTGPLPEGVLLTPALPPADEARAGLRFLAGTRIECLEFAVGAARLALRVSVDRDGLEVHLRHLGGGPTRVRVLPPLPRGIDPGLVFADWEKRPGHTGPVEFALDAEAPEHSLWLTFHPPDERWPSPRVEMLQPPAPGREIVLVSPRGDELHLARFAEALEELLGVSAAARAAGFRPAGALEPLVLQLGDGPSAERKLVEYVGLSEAFALRTPIR